MNKNRRQKKALTLLEIMIVIFLITIITGVVGYNMKGALDKGKAFRTERAIEQLKDLLFLAAAEGKEPAEDLIRNLPAALARTGLAKNPDDLLKDGWGSPFEVSYQRKGNEFIVRSKRLDDYNKGRSAAKPTDAAGADEE